jgi:hypothetical protein
MNSEINKGERLFTLISCIQPKLLVSDFVESVSDDKEVDFE